MKTQLKLLLIACMVLVFTSCEQSEVPDNPITQIQTVQKAKGVLRYTIRLADFDSELEELMKEDGTGMKAIFSNAHDRTMLDVLIDYNDDDDPPPAIVCEGSGVSFVGCCSSYFDDNPGGCLVITFDESTGDHQADDDF